MNLQTIPIIMATASAYSEVLGSVLTKSLRASISKMEEEIDDGTFGFCEPKWINCF